MSKKKDIRVNMTQHKSKENICLMLAGAVLIVSLVFLGKWALDFIPKNERKPIISATPEEIISPFEAGLKSHSSTIAEGLRQFLSEHTVNNIENSKNIESALVKINSDIIKDFDQGSLNKLLNHWSAEIQKFGWGEERKPFRLLSIEDKLIAIADYLIKDVGFIYSSDKIDFDGQKENKQGGTTVMENIKGEDLDPAPYLISNLLKKQQGNCATFPVVYVMLARRLGLTHTKLVTIDKHQFCRYDDGETKFNIETTNPEGMGVGTKDFKYIRDFKPSPAMLKNSTTMKSQTFRQEISSMLVTKAAYLQKSGSHPELMEETIALSYYFDPHSIYALNNMIELVKTKKEMKNQKAIMNALTERGYRLGVILPEPEKVRQIEHKISEVIGTHKKLFSQISSLRKNKIRVQQEIKRIEQAEFKLHSTNGQAFNQLQNQQQKNEYNQKQFTQKRAWEREKFNLQKEYRFKIDELIKLTNNIKENISSLMKEDYLLDVSTIQRLRFIDGENRQNYNKVLELQY